MKQAKYRTYEEWQKVVSEQGKACKKLNEIIDKKNKEIFEKNKELLHFKNYSRSLEIQLEKLKSQDKRC